jgi:hypothetical protein
MRAVLPTILNVMVMLVIGLGGGGLAAWYSIQTNHGFGAVTIGRWTAWPLEGDVNADPYTEAKVASEGSVPLGAAEGLAFSATRDDAGDLLLRQCRYLVSGSTPAARLWTLSAYSAEQAVIAPLAGADSKLHSGATVRNPDGSFDLTISPFAATGNWMSISGEGPFQLVLRLYDTPVTGSAGIVDPVIPAIRKLDCLS